MLLAAFCTAIFLGALLVFLIQPLVTRMVLPQFGGAAAVWNTALVFFQLLLLAGYAWAHVTVRLLGLRRQPALQLLLLLAPVGFLPFALPDNAAPGDAVAPAPWLLYVLAVTAGVPYLVVTTAGPLLQRWFSGTRHPAARDPYFLYAAGNVGSLLALLAYPAVIEPRFTLAEQGWIWTWAYLAFAVSTAACALFAWRWSVLREQRAGEAIPELREAPPTGPGSAERPWWQVVALAAAPSALVVATTTHATTDLAAIPLLWVLPLALYLLTFVVAFANTRWFRPAHAGVLLAVVAMGVVAAGSSLVDAPLWVRLALDLLLVLFGGLLAHGLLAQARPSPERLTSFYLLLSLGGVIGGASAALLPPVVFDDVHEYPLAIAAVLLARQSLRNAPRWRTRGSVLFLAGTAALAIGIRLLREHVEPELLSTEAWDALLLAAALGLAVGAARRPVGFACVIVVLLHVGPLPGTDDVLYQERTFYGVLRVDAGDAPGERRLFHGTTLHGNQRFPPAGDPRQPVGYYDEDGPIGNVFRVLQRQRPFTSVGVVGLGTGSLAAYGKAGQAFVFYDVDPAVIRVARDQRLFTYLSDTRADVTTLRRDGRRGVADAPAGFFDVVVIDAFSSDAIPVHLLTAEALDVYLSRVSERGVVALHISNRHLDLRPVVVAAARTAGASAVARQDDYLTTERIARGASPSHWVVISRRRSNLVPLLEMTDSGWSEQGARSSVRPWTDNYSNVLSVVTWG